MKVAIAGTGPVAQYLIEELLAFGHNVVVLTRSSKPTAASFLYRQTDYTTSSLVAVLSDVNALVSTVADYTDTAAVTRTHLAMLEACKQSARCKTFIPSEWTSNAEEYPEQPMFFTDGNKVLHSALKEAEGIKWTIICNSWFADYILPANRRHLRDIGAIWPMDHATKTFTIYGPGTQTVDMVAVRDVAKAVAHLLASDQVWEQYTYLSGQQLTWNTLFAIMREHDQEWKSVMKPLASTLNQIVQKRSAEEVLLGQFEILSYSGASALPAEKVRRQRERYFRDVNFRTVGEVLRDAEMGVDGIV